MIQSVRGRLIESIVSGRRPKGFPAELIGRTINELTILDNAVALKDLQSPPGNRLELLKGNRGGQHSVRINDQWRICFRWTAAGPEDVEIVDYR